MKPLLAQQKFSKLSHVLMAAALGLALSAARPAAAQQNSSDNSQSTEPQGNPPGAPEMPEMEDQQQPADGPMQSPDAPAQMETPPNVPPPAGQAAPQSLTVPAGTVIRVRVDEWLTSDRNLAGDSFTAVLEEPIVVDGWVVARRGQSETGRVTIAKKGRIGEASQLGLDLPELTLVDGRQLALQTQMFQASPPANRDRDVATVGTTTGVGAVIGAIAGGGTGAAIGAGLGATAGVIGVMSTRGRPTTIPPETVVSFRLQAPVTITTDKSNFAFQPVKQSDYDSRPLQNRPRMRRPGPPPPGYYPYPYAYAYPYPYGWYGGPYVGVGYGRWWR